MIIARSGPVYMFRFDIFYGVRLSKVIGRHAMFTLALTLDATGRTPMYEQLYAAIAGAIRERKGDHSVG